jgi:hypothetical protein
MSLPPPSTFDFRKMSTFDFRGTEFQVLVDNKCLRAYKL